MIEFLNSLTWPGVVAILGSVVTIVSGLLAMLVTIYRKNPPISNTKKTLTEVEYEKLHSRISDTITRVSEIEGDIKELRASIRSLQKQIADHEQRDIDDFKLVDAKLDRLMDIIVRILQDDKL